MSHSATVVDLKSRARRLRAGDAACWPETLRILLVEDDPIDAKLFIWTARRIGIPEEHVETVSEEAAARARIESGRFGLCVVDYWLGPDESARLIEDLGADPAGPPVLVLSNLTPEEMLEVYRPSDRLRLLSKTQLGLDTLKDAIESLVCGPTQHRSPPMGFWNGETLLAVLHDARAILSRIDAHITIADSHLSSQDHDAAHSLLLSAGQQADALKTKFDALERVVRMRYSESQ